MDAVVAGGEGISPCRQRDIDCMEGVVGTVQSEAAAVDGEGAVGLQALGAGVLRKLRLTAAAGGDGEVAAVDGQGGGTLNAVTVGGDGKCTAVDGEDAVGLRVVRVRGGLQTVVPGGESEDAAVHDHGAVGGQGVVGCGDVQRQIGDGDGCARASLNAVFAGALDVQRAAAGEGKGRAALYLDGCALKGVAGLLGGGVLRVGQGAFTSRLDGDGGGFAAGDGGGFGAGQGEAVQHQRYAGDILFHGDAALAAGAGEGIGSGCVDGQVRTVDLIAAALVGGGDGGVGKGKDVAVGGGGDAGGQQDSKKYQGDCHSQNR
ncbi:hypothetical protein SDC9_110915 [bioreactor metagenome]|uniref:Uncharacterized protein n=1 Tax=bioreactor metagenome TaxID=1076179 RepID=A0A645BF06_9ZZZZ